MANSVYFNGNLIQVPGAYSAIDTKGISTKSSFAENKTLALIGECKGGEPGAVQFLSTPLEAKSVLKSGDLLKACEKAWNPVSSSKEGVDLGGANIIACIRTNKATKSTSSIYSAADQSNPQVVFSSKDWGDSVNYQYKISDGTEIGTKSIVVYDQQEETYETFDNLGKLFKVAYTGTSAYATLSITKNADGTLQFTTKIGAAQDSTTTDIDIKLDPKVYKTIKSFMYDLQAYSNYAIETYDSYNLNITVADLDFITDLNIKSTTSTPNFPVTAIYADIASTLENSSKYIQVTRYDRTKGAILNTTGYITMTGGTEGTSPASWVDFFDTLSGFDIDYIVPLTSDESIHAELLSHITTCSGIMGRERRGIVGGAIGETISKTTQRAHNLSSSRMQVVHGGFYDVDEDNNISLYPPYILAAQHGGRAAFLPEGESATHDTYRMSSPEYILSSDEITKLLQGGCLAFEYVLAGNTATSFYVRLVQDLTTDTLNTASIYSERATGQLADSLNKEIRKSLDSMFTGKRMSQTDLVSAENTVISILQNRYRDGYILGFKDVSITKTGGTMTVDYSVAAAEPNNFTLITAHYYTETLSTGV